MGRSQLHGEEKILDAALRVVVARGPGQASMAAIASEMGAPTGSIYHRYPSRDLLLASVWLRTAVRFQEGFLRRLDAASTLERGVVTALYTPDWVRAHPLEAKLLLVHRRDDLLATGLPAEVQARSQKLGAELGRGFRGFSARWFGDSSRPSMGRVAFALAEVPLAAVRKYAEAETSPPAWVDSLIRDASEAILRRERRKS